MAGRIRELLGSEVRRDQSANERGRDWNEQLQCDSIGIYWRLHIARRRPQAIRPVCAHALSETERQQIVWVANEPRFAELPPARIVPMLADEGTYIASESSFSRVLRASGQVRH